MSKKSVVGAAGEAMPLKKRISASEAKKVTGLLRLLLATTS
ncbi:MAG: hypothetical protein ACRCXC_12055 [Legionella sp.]